MQRRSLLQNFRQLHKCRTRRNHPVSSRHSRAVFELYKIREYVKITGRQICFPVLHLLEDQKQKKFEISRK